jgi:hypothetical protein
MKIIFVSLLLNILLFCINGKKKSRIEIFNEKSEGLFSKVNLNLKI